MQKTAKSNPENPTIPAPEDALPPTRKTCRTCRENLPLTAFYQQRSCLKTHRRDCIECTARRGSEARAAAWKQQPPETLRCRWCRESKPIDQFVYDTRCLHGRRKICQACYAQALHDSKTGRDLNVPDDRIIPRTAAYERRIDLGLAIARATFPPGHQCTYEEIAAFTGLAPSTIRNIEMRALVKLRAAAIQILREKGVVEFRGEELP